MNVQRIMPANRPFLRQIAAERWGSPEIVVHGQTYHVDDLDGYIVEAAGGCAGVVTFVITDDECEIVTLDSLMERQGIGSALLEKAIEVARAAECRRVWLVTTNDNVAALGFYQRRGFRIVALYAGAVDNARQVKPNIPTRSDDGIEIHDEIELELRLDHAA
jgi:ribosomal protein S18 acetylase RimI-like enzyme